MSGTRKCLGMGLLLLATVAAPAAQAVDASDADRSYRNFVRDSAVVDKGQFRFEFQGQTIHDESQNRLSAAGFRTRAESLTMWNMNAIASYGLMKGTEVGLVLPWTQTSVRTVDDLNQISKNSTDSVGDLRIYAKHRIPLGQRCSIAAGLEASAPTGSQRRQIGLGEPSFHSFVATRYTYKAFGLGAQGGYQLITDDVPDVITWAGDVFVRAGDSYVIRTEVVGRVFQQGGFTNHDIEVWPGIDFHYTENLMIRAAGMKGATGLAHEWGLGFGAAYRF